MVVLEEEEEEVEEEASQGVEERLGGLGEGKDCLEAGLGSVEGKLDPVKEAWIHGDLSVSGCISLVDSPV